VDWWRNKPSWDALFRGALFQQDYDTAISIARDRVRRGDSKDAEYILNTGACYSYQENAAAVGYFRSIENEIRDAFPFEERFHLMALNDVALVLGPCEEGFASGERVVAGWERIGTPRDSQDAWPKREDAANLARGRLALLYIKAGRIDDANRVFPFELCRHLRPLQVYLSTRGVDGTYLLNDRMQLVYSVEVVLDVDSMKQRVPHSPEVRTVDYFDRRSAYDDLGFECETHGMWILGIHHEGLSEGDPRRDRANWVS
jgi:hypothetical protein